MDTQSPKQMNTDMIEKMLREKVQSIIVSLIFVMCLGYDTCDAYSTVLVMTFQIMKNTKNIVKAMRLYDYNRDNHIQRHELRKVLENYCFKMTDQQYDK